jgi:phage FluMu protein gp41
MARKHQPLRTKTHPELDKFDVSVTAFGEIEGSMSVDKINKFLDRNVKDIKLNKKQIDDSDDKYLPPITS